MTLKRCPHCFEAYYEPTDEKNAVADALYLWWHRFDYEGNKRDDPSHARDELLKLLRPVAGLSTLADMFDLGGKTYWKLELKRRRGNPGTWSRLDAELVAHEYAQAWEEFAVSGAKSPDKAAIGKLAKEFKTTDEAIRQLLKRGHKSR
jgi:hypothetical protein